MSAPWPPATALHLASLGGVVACLLLRGRALRGPLDEAGVRRVLRVDDGLGLALFGLMASGVWLLFGSAGVGAALHLGSPPFWVKMGLFATAWGVEILPMLTFARWRSERARGLASSPARVPLLRRLHLAALALVLAAIPAAILGARHVDRLAHRAAAPAPEAAEIAAGEAIYKTRCAPCHQLDGRGIDGKVAADFAGDPTRLRKDDAALLRSIEHGVLGTAMRGFAFELDEKQRRAVLRYIRKRFGKASAPRP